MITKYIQLFKAYQFAKYIIIRKKRKKESVRVQVRLNVAKNNTLLLVRTGIQSKCFEIFLCNELARDTVTACF